MGVQAPRRRRVLGIGLVVLGAVVLVVYGGIGLYGMQAASATAGGCHAEQAAFTPAAFRTDPAAAVSGEFDASTLDPAPYLMPAYEEVTFAARGEPAVTIHAWWVAATTAAGTPAAATDAPAIVVVHGWGACRRDPAILVPAGMLHRAGFGVLVMDMRNHGDSTRTDGRYDFGSSAYRDVLGAWDWLVGRGVPVSRIGLFGQSGGAPAVMVAMGEDARVAAGWEESGPADIWTVAGEEARRNGLPEIAVPAAVFWYEAIGDDVVGRSPLNEAARFGTRPFQVVHGTADGRVSSRNAVLLADAIRRVNPAAPAAWLIDGSHHVEGPFLQTAEYEARLRAFFRAALG